MDAIAGAAILAERFSMSARVAVAPRSTSVHPNALPIFHWIGIEPPAAGPATEPDECPPDIGLRLRLLKFRLRARP